MSLLIFLPTLLLLILALIEGGGKNLKRACLLLSRLDQSGLGMSDMSEILPKRLASLLELEQLIDPRWPDSWMSHVAQNLGQKQAHIIQCIPMFTLRTGLFVRVLVQGPESVLQAVQEKKRQISFTAKKQVDSGSFFHSGVGPLSALKFHYILLGVIVCNEERLFIVLFLKILFVNWILRLWDCWWGRWPSQSLSIRFTAWAHFEWQQMKWD